MEFQKSSLPELKNRGVLLLESIFAHGLGPDEVREADALAIDIVYMIIQEAGFIDTIKVNKDYEPYVFTHPFLTSVFSTMIALKLGWKNTKTLKAIALGALLQDIGMRELPHEIKVLAPIEMNPEQLKIYQRHPEHGVDMVSRFGTIPASVQQIIYQHHECNGAGFPKAIQESKIYSLAKVVCLAERYTRILIEKSVIPVDGLSELLANKFEVLQHDPEITRALIKSFIKETK